MGWVELGRPTLLVHPASPAVLARMVRARVPAAKWSDPVDYGDHRRKIAGLCLAHGLRDNGLHVGHGQRALRWCRKQAARSGGWRCRSRCRSRRR